MRSKWARGIIRLIVAVHAAWLIALWIFGRDQDVNLLALSLFVALQGVRAVDSRHAWRRAGPRASSSCRTRTLVATGPYRYLSHPNYAVVAGEIAVLPLALHLPVVAVVFTILNAAVLTIRIRAETRAFAARERARATS